MFLCDETWCGEDPNTNRVTKAVDLASETEIVFKRLATSPWMGL